MEEKISLYDILEVNEMDTDEMTSYYHIPSHCMVVISEEDLEYAKSGKDISMLEEWKQESIAQASDFLNNENNYLSFPKDDDYNEIGVMKQFIESIKDDTASYEKLKDTNSIRTFKDELFKVDLIDSWYDFREEKFLQVAARWCEENKVIYEK